MSGNGSFACRSIWNESATTESRRQLSMGFVGKDFDIGEMVIANLSLRLSAFQLCAVQLLDSARGPCPSPYLKTADTMRRAFCDLGFGAEEKSIIDE